MNEIKILIICCGVSVASPPEPENEDGSAEKKDEKRDESGTIESDENIGLAGFSRRDDDAPTSSKYYINCVQIKKYVTGFSVSYFFF